MATVTVPEKRCFGLKVEGRKYNPDRRGRIEIENPRHARAVKAALGESGRITVGFSGATAKVCPTCEFRAFLFTQECPRCGTDLRLPA